jgi:hypothetical protein
MAPFAPRILTREAALSLDSIEKSFHCHHEAKGRPLKKGP